jgi:hypothetical protein
MIIEIFGIQGLIFHAHEPTYNPQLDIHSSRENWRIINKLPSMVQSSLFILFSFC